MRSYKRFTESHLKLAINLPWDEMDSNAFINWDPEDIYENRLHSPDKKVIFKERKRRYIYLIPTHNLIPQEICKDLHRIFDPDSVSWALDIMPKSDLVSLRNSLILYKALKLGWKRQNVFLCMNGQKVIE